MIYLLNFFKNFVLINLFFNLKAIVRYIISFTMNFKERGITVGDLLLLIIIISVTSFLVKNFNKDKQTALMMRNQELISYNKTDL